MIFNKIQFERYDIDLIDPLQNSQMNIAQRSGSIIKLFLDDVYGRGEAAPLLPYSNESLMEISWGLEELKSALGDNANYSENELFELFELYSNKIPTLHFALDLALYDILSIKRKISIAKYLNENNLDILKFSSIHNGPINKSFKKIKVKIGVGSLDNEISLLNDLFNEYSQDVEFRLDANQAYSIDEFLYLYNRIKHLNIEYIEEPLCKLNKKNLKIIKNECDASIAIDESLFHQQYKEFAENGLIDYAVIKPSLLGGVKSIIKMVNFFKKNNIDVIFSSALETEVGNLASIHLASALELKNHHGLNNYSFYNLDQNVMPYSKTDTSISLKRINGLGICAND